MKQNLAVIMLVGIFMLAFIMILTNMPISSAQNEADKTIKTLLERILEDEGLSISILFKERVSDGRIDWILPDFGQGGTGERYLEEIGNDYFCAEQVGAGVSPIICVPYSNIAYIYYIH